MAVFAASVVLCLFTLAWCVALVRKTRRGPVRYLVGLTGLLSVYHGSRVLGQHVDATLDAEATGLLMTAIYLAAVAILEFYIVEAWALRCRLRLAEAESSVPKPFRVADPHSADVLYRAMADACPLAAFAVDLSGKTCFWNASAEAMFGWTRREVLGEVSPIVLRKDGDANWTVRKDGQRIDVSYWLAPFHTSASEMQGTLTMVSRQRPRRGESTRTASSPVPLQQSAAGNPCPTGLPDADCPV